MGRRVVSIAVVALGLVGVAIYVGRSALPPVVDSASAPRHQTMDSSDNGDRSRAVDGVALDASVRSGSVTSRPLAGGDSDRKPTANRVGREPFAPDVMLAAQGRVMTQLSYVDAVRRYGLRSVPASRSPERFALDFGLRRAVPGSDNQIIATQNRAVLSNQELGIFRVQAVRPTSQLHVEAATLERWRSRSAPEDIGVAVLRGVTVPGADGTQVTAWSGIVDPAVLHGQPGTIRVQVPTLLDDREFTQTFQFIFSGDSPADITGITGHRSDSAGVTLNLGVNVKQEGNYTFEARVWNQAGEAVALVKSGAPLGVGSQTTPLVISPGFVRDGMPPGRYRVTDVEGGREAIGGAQSTEVVVPWRGSYWFDIADGDALIPAHTTPAATPRQPVPRIERKLP